MKKLHIAKDLTLPLETVTQTIAILARKGSGKTFTARRLAEEIFRAGMQVVDVDPKGDHWGMRSSPDGKGPGLGFIILGGEHGDLPLEPGSGELVAKLVVEELVSVILDLSHFRKSEVAKFMTDFGENLYRLKAREQYRSPMMLLIDEADAVAPQKPQHGEERMLGAIEDIVRRGRQRGIGCTLVTQRSAVLNKNVLTQAQIMVAMRTIAPQDLKAMDEWIDVHGTREQRATLMESLPSLPKGDAWVWSPGWPTDEGIFQRIHVMPIETFDSGATPEPGQKRIEPKERADVDLEALRRQMAATVERAKANDPGALRRRIAELEKMLKTTEDEMDRLATTTQPKPKEIPALKQKDLNRLEMIAINFALDGDNNAIAEIEEATKSLNRTVERVTQALAAGREVAATLRATMQGPVKHPAQVEEMRRSATSPLDGDQPRPPGSPGRVYPGTGAAWAPAPMARRPPPNGQAPEGEIGKGERAILTATAQHQVGVTREQLTVLTGYKRSSRDTYLQRLTSRGLVVSAGDRLLATGVGIAFLGPAFEPLPTGSALLDHWRRKLPPGELACLEVLVAAWPEPVDRERISEATQYQRSSRDTYLQRLRSRQLVVEAGRGQVRVSPMLMEVQ